MNPSPGHEAARLGWMADRALTAGRLAEAGALYARALEAWRAADNPAGQGVTLANLGLVREAEGAHTQALAYFQEALKIQESRGDLRLQGVILGNLGGLHLVRGELDTAQALFLEALDRAEATGDRQREAGALIGLGAAHHDAGRLELARQQAVSGLAVAQAAMADGAVAAARANLGSLAQEEGDAETAAAHYHAACTIYGAKGQRANLAATLLSMAKLRMEIGEDPMPWIDQARGLAEGIGDRRTLALVDALEAVARHHAGRPGAEALMARARQDVDPVEHPIRHAVLALHAAHLHLPERADLARAALPEGFVPSAAIRTAARLLLRAMGG